MEESGCYIAVKYNHYSFIKIKKLAEKYQVPNIIPLDKFHTTLIYSTTGVDDVEINYNIQYAVLPSKLEIWTYKSGENCLVLKVDCNKLVDRNLELMDKYQFVSGYPVYIPHITISYSVGDWNRIDEMQSYLNNNKIYNMLVTSGEYQEKLETEWSETL